MPRGAGGGCPGARGTAWRPHSATVHARVRNPLGGWTLRVLTPRTHTHTRGRRRGRRWLDCGKRLTAPGVRTITPRTLHAHLLRVSCTSVKLETRLESGQRSDISPPNRGNAESVSGGCRLGGVLDTGAGAWGRGTGSWDAPRELSPAQGFPSGQASSQAAGRSRVCDRAPGTAPGGVTGCSAGCPQSRSA